MEIRVLGDFEIAREILLGVARLFANPDGALVTSAPAALLAGFLLWSFIKWAMDNEKAPYPAKEFVFGIAFWLIFGGGPMSPKYSVELTSVRENRFQVIDDVPFLAAVPSWLASSFFGSARELMEDNFSPLHYSKSSDSRTPDPLNALIELYDSGAGVLLDPYLSESISTYMVQCYEIEKTLNGSPHTNTRAELDTRPIHESWHGVKVNYNFLTAKYYTVNEKNGVETDCGTIWENVRKKVFEDVDFITSLQNTNTSKGASANAIEDASSMIYAASTHTSPNPLQIQQGLFLSYSIRDGLSQTALEHWGDKMVFEAQRKRVYESAGERAMFMQIMIPIITAIETFAFFIAPVMMVLSVLGGSGLALIMKYLMLVLFINLWGFIKVFVDLFTSITIERAFSAKHTVDPFAFGSYANTFSELEGFLSVASSMTVAIPFFAMFLLYGGVHSVMGVMRTLGGGSVDGNNMAPTMSTSMNNGVMQMGDRTFTQMAGSGNFAKGNNIGTDAGLGSMSVSTATNSSFNNTASTAQAAVKSEVAGWQQSASTTFSSSNVKGVAHNGGETFDASTMTADQQMAALGHRLEESGLVSKGKGGQAAAALMAEASSGASLKGDLGSHIAGLAARFGVDAKAAANIKGSWSEDEKNQWSDLAAKVNNWSDTDTYTSQSGKTTTYSNMNGSSVSNDIGKSGADLLSRSQQLSKTSSTAEATASEVGNQTGLNKTSMVNLNALDAATRGQTYNRLNDMYNGFSEQTKQRLSDIGINDADTLMKATANGGGDGQSFVHNLATMDTLLGRSDSNDLKQSARDHQIQAGAYRYAASLIRDEHSSGFVELAKAHEAVANSALGINQISTDIPKVDSTKTPTAQDVQTAYDGTSTSVANAHKSAVTPDNMMTAVVASEGPGKRDVDGKPISAVTGNDAEQRVSQHKKDAENIDLLNSRAGQGMMDLANGGIAMIDNAINGIFGPSLIWGKNEEGQIFQSQFSAGGNQSNQLATGFNNLAQMPVAQIRSQFDGNKPSDSAYAMNDVVRSFQGAGGDDVWKKIPDTESGMRFKAAVTEFEAQKSKLPQSEQDKMDAISDARINGTLPDSAANRLIQNDRAAPDDKANMFNNVNYAGEGFIISNTPSLNENKVIREMAGASDSERLDTRHRNAGESNAVSMFANDEAERIVSAGEYKFENGMYVPGVNRAYTDNDNSEGVSEATRKAISNQVSSAATVGTNSAANNDASDLHPQVHALVNSQLGDLAARLSGSGLEGNANQVREFVGDTSAIAVGEGIVTTTESLSDKAQLADRIVLHKDDSGLQAYTPAESKNNSVVEYNTRQLTGNGNDFASTASMVGESEDGRVLFKGEGRGTSRGGSDGAESNAFAAASSQLGINAIQDKQMNVALNRGLADNNGEVPLSFKTDTGVEFNMVDQSANGSYIFDGGARGQFTYQSGDDRLMPTDDNPNYAKVENKDANAGKGNNVVYVK